MAENDLDRVAGTAYKAGETITFNGLAPATSAAAWDRDQGKPFKLYPKDVYEEGFSVEVETSVVRTTQARADEIGVELTFPRGLAHIENDPSGKRADRTVNIRIRQSPAGANAWTTVTTKSVTARQLTPLFIGHRWRTADYGTADPNRRYNVEITNLSGQLRRGAQLRPLPAHRAQNDHDRESGRGPRRRHARRPHPVLGAAARRSRRVSCHCPDHRPRL